MSGTFSGSDCETLEYGYRSSDGSDSEGSLVDFIAGEEDEEEEGSQASDGDATLSDLLDDFPSGRPKRERKAPVRYEDPDFMRLVLKGEDTDEVVSALQAAEASATALDVESDEEEYIPQITESSSDEDSDDEEEGEEDEAIIGATTLSLEPPRKKRKL